MKILVLGASGMAGHIAAVYFQEQGHEIDTIAAHTKLNNDTKILDITNQDNFLEVLTKNYYDIVINCIGVLVRESIEDEERAIYLNSYLPKMLEEYYKNSKTRIFHISSDGIFSGAQKEYIENSLFDGQSVYSRSKALGEINNSKDLTLRTSIIGPEISPKRFPSLFDWFFAQDGEITGYTNSLWRGVTTIQLAKGIEAAIEQNITGTYHLVPAETISKFDLLTLFKKEFHKDNLSVIPSEGTGINTILRNTRSDFSYKVPSYSDMIREMSLWIKTHERLYPHYKV